MEGGISRLDVHASITARRLFTRAGYTFVGQRNPVVRGVEFVNFHMSKPVHQPAEM